MTYRPHAVHYTPNGGSLGWCGRAVGWHTALPATKLRESVTCKQCRKQIQLFDAAQAKLT